MDANETTSPQIKTKNQSTWKRNIVLSIGVLVALVVTGIISSQIYEYIMRQPRAEETFVGLKIDMSKDDVKFMKGEPYKIVDNDLFAYIEDTCLEMIQFKGGEIHKIEIANLESLISRCEVAIQGIGFGARYELVVDKFGEPSHIEISEDSFRRILSYDKFNIFFELAKGKVQRIGIYMS